MKNTNNNTAKYTFKLFFANAKELKMCRMFDIPMAYDIKSNIKEKSITILNSELSETEFYSQYPNVYCATI